MSAITYVRPTPCRSCRPDASLEITYKEDNVLFNMGEKVLTEQDQSLLCSRFCETTCRSFAGKRREELEQLAAGIRGGLGITNYKLQMANTNG